MTDIAAEVVGPVDRPPVPTETPEVWVLGKWVWCEYPFMEKPEWMFAVSVNYSRKELAEAGAKPGDILIRIPASGVPTPKRENWGISQNSDGSVGMRKELPKGGGK